MRPCLDCGTPTRGSRCPPHAQAEERRRHAGRTWDERKRRTAAIEEHVEVSGCVCPGYGRGPHAVPRNMLTADHVIPRASGGEEGPLRVLCRSCNSRRGAGA